MAISVTRTSKFGAIKTVIGGIKFASKGEAARYSTLVTLQKVGVISDLKLQEAFILAPSVVIHGRKRPPLKYVCDFTYLENGVRVVEDFKGVRTPVYVCKRHLMKHIHNIDIRETGTK